MFQSPIQVHCKWLQSILSSKSSIPLNHHETLYVAMMSPFYKRVLTMFTIDIRDEKLAATQTMTFKNKKNGFKQNTNWFLIVLELNWHKLRAFIRFQENKDLFTWSKCIFMYVQLIISQTF